MIVLQPTLFRQERKRLAVVDRLPVAVLFDNFSSVVDGVSLASRVPPVRPNANTWTIGSGTWLGNAQRAESNFATITSGTLVFDTGKVDLDLRVRFRFSAGGTNRNAGIAFRYQNITNTWYASCKVDGGTYQLVNLAANIHNVIATGSYPFVIDTDYTMRVVVQGDNITVTVEGIGALSTISSVRNTMTSHGLRSASTAGGGSIYYDDFIALDPPPVADVVLTVNSSPLLASAYQTGISHVVGADLLTGNATAKARAQASLATAMHFHRVSACDSFGTVGPWLWDGTGTQPPEPNSWTSLDNNMAMVAQMGGTPVIGWGNWPWFLKGNWNGTTTTDLVPSDEFIETKGRPYTERMSDILLLVQRTVERYAVAPYNVKYWQLGPWEFHGFFLGRDGTFFSLGYDNLPGAANEASMGMAYLHNQVAARIVSTMTALGIARNTYKIITNYVPTRSYGTGSSSFWYPAPHPLRAQVWGSADKRFVDALILHVAALDPALYDIWGWDINSLNFDSVNLTDDWSVQQKMSDFASYFISQIGLSKAIWVSEYYPKPVTDPGTNSQQYRAAIIADAHIRMIVQGVQSILIWSPAGRGNDPPIIGTNPEAALVTPVNVSTGGVTTPIFDAIKVLHDYFSAGTPIYDYTVVSGTGISAIFSATKGYLINKSATPKTVAVGGVVYSLAGSECKVIDIIGPVETRLFADSFSGGGQLTAHQPDTVWRWGGWFTGGQAADTWTLSGSGAVANASLPTGAQGTRQYFAWHPQLTYEPKVTCSFTTPAAGVIKAGVLVRMVDANNAWCVRFNNSNNKIEILRLSSGTLQAVNVGSDAAFTVAYSTTYTLVVTVIGNTITATCNGVTATEPNATQNPTASNVGIFESVISTDSHIAFNDLAVELSGVTVLPTRIVNFPSDSSLVAEWDSIVTTGTQTSANAVVNGNGRSSLAITANGSTSAVRMEFMCDTAGRVPTPKAAQWIKNLPDEAYYTCYYWFPAQVQRLGSFWNIFQWKQRAADASTWPVYSLNVGWTTDHMHFEANTNMVQANGSYNAGEPDLTSVHVSVPIGQWIKVEAFYKWSPNPDGRLTWWLDNTVMWDFTGIRTLLSTGNDWAAPHNPRQWGPCHYSNGLGAGSKVIYIDNASISYLRQADNYPAAAPV